MADLISLKLLPQPLLKLGGAWPLPIRSGMAVRVKYEVPLVHLGSVLLRTDPALGLTGRHTTSEVLTEAGFEFAHPTLDGTLRDLHS